MQQTVTIIKRFFGEEWKTLMILSALTVVFSLPVVTIGPALLALNGVLTRISDNRCDLSRIREFLNVFKRKFKRGLLLEVLAAIYIWAMLYARSLAESLSQGGTVVWVFLTISLSLAAMVSVYFVPLLADSRIPFFQALWDSVCLALAKLPRTLLAVAAVYGLGFVFILLYPISVLLYALFVLGAMAALSVAVTWPVISETVLTGSEKVV